MAKRELILPIDVAPTREALANSCAFLRRSQIDDTLFRRPDGVLARLRKQDTVTRMSCTHPGVLAETPETIVLDHQACHRLLELLGFEAVDRVRFMRESWRSCQYLMHLDRTEGLGDFLTLEAEAGGASPHAFRRLTLKYLKKLGISISEGGACPVDPKGLYGVDSSEDLAYTAPIVQRRPTAFEAGRTT